MSVLILSLVFGNPLKHMKVHFHLTGTRFLRLIMRLNVAPGSTTVEYIPISVVSALITWWLNRIICVCVCVHNYARIVHMSAFSKPLWDSSSQLLVFIRQPLHSVSPGRILEEKPAVLSNHIWARKRRFVWRMRETLLSGVSRSCYCNSFSLLCCSNSQDETAVLMMVVLHFALFMALVLPCAGLRAAIPTPAAVDFAMETGHGYHA